MHHHKESMKIQFIKACCLPDGMAAQPGQQLDIVADIGMMLIVAGKAEAMPEPYPTPLPCIEMRDPVIECRDPVIKRKRGRPKKGSQMPSGRLHER
jgi:hypothetical protein